MLGNVQQKVHCVFETKVIEEPSSKRSYQPYKVLACEILKQSAISSDIFSAIPTEKCDGTCVYIEEFEGKPWMWARLDRKPNKNADKKFKKYQNAVRLWELEGKKEEGRPSTFLWDIPKDFKDVPPEWIPATGVPLVDNIPQPDENGHIPGWVPLDPCSRQHLWHLSTVDFDAGGALVIQQQGEEYSGKLEILLQPLRDLQGLTMELIGTNINGNPYRIGTKKQPVHFLVRHGNIPFKEPPPVDFQKLKKWFIDSEEGSVEGVVWHCSNGSLFKVHRHHLGLQWPVENLKMNQCPITNAIDLEKYEFGFSEKSMILKLGEQKGRIYKCLTNISLLVED